ncbi:MAG: phenylalanine--tRNA ligase subunit beta, partial [Catalinimonas sp.]
PRAAVRSLLERLEIEVAEAGEGALALRVPPYRVDVRREADVAEEVLRLWGFDKLEVSPHLRADFLSPFPPVEPLELQRRVGTTLTGAGYCEMWNNSLGRADWAERLGHTDRRVQMLNPLSEDVHTLRTDLLFSGLEVVRRNVSYRQTELRLFEFGKTYARREQGGYDESVRLALFVQGDQQPESWRAKSTPADFHDLAATVVLVLEKLGATGWTQEQVTDDPRFAYALLLTLNHRAVGTLGRVAPEWAAAVELKEAVYYADLDWQYLAKRYHDAYTYQEVSRFPAVRRDLSLQLDAHVTFEAIQRLARRTERKLLRDVNVFDVYEGENLGAAKKSYAVSFHLQDPNRTLQEKEIDKTMKRLMAAFERELGAVIRR